MATTAPTPAKTASRSANQPLVPPEERFWKRYSPHGEMPLSGASSLGLHLLVFGLIALLGIYGALWFNRTSRSLPVEAVRLGGGGGNPRGAGDGPGTGKAPEEVGAEKDAPKPDPIDPVKRPPLKVEAGPRTPIKFDDAAVRFIQRTETDSARAFQRLADANTRIRVPDGKPAGRGTGGTGSGGGSGDGVGKGNGNGRGEGHGTLTQREKRMLRWSMLFNTNNGNDYVSQLKGLGAILAIPVREDASGRVYKIVRNLSAPAKLLDEDISKIQRIYWIDDKPQSVMDVMTTLRVSLRPSHFVAFMPEELEAKLFQMEKAYLEKHSPGRTEDAIVETKFRINRTGGRYQPEVTSQKVK